MLTICVDNQLLTACLSAYNNGMLHGDWITCDKTSDELQDAIKEMLARSPVSATEACEEWAIHDDEGFGCYKVSEWENLEVLAEIGTLFTDSHNPELILGLMDWNLLSIEEAREYYENCYIGEFNNVADFAENHLDSMGELYLIPEHIRYHIDFMSYGRDMEISGQIFTIDNHYFYSQ